MLHRWPIILSTGWRNQGAVLTAEEAAKLYAGNIPYNDAATW
jgi:hypothetical protein